LANSIQPSKHKLAKRIVNNCELYNKEFDNLMKLDYHEVALIYNSFFVALIIKKNKERLKLTLQSEI